MDVREAIDDLLEDKLRITLSHRSSLLEELEHVTAASVLHYHEQVLLRFEDFKQSDHV